MIIDSDIPILAEKLPVREPLLCLIFRFAINPNIGDMIKEVIASNPKKSASILSRLDDIAANTLKTITRKMQIDDATARLEIFGFGVSVLLFVSFHSCPR